MAAVLLGVFHFATGTLLLPVPPRGFIQQKAVVGRTALVPALVCLLHREGQENSWHLLAAGSGSVTLKI